MYTADLVSVIEQHGLSPHLYADNTQMYGFCPPSDVGCTRYQWVRGRCWWLDVEQSAST